jgi:hypothetical protein
MAAVALAAGLGALVVVSGEAAASIAGSASLKLSGAGKGTLHEGSSAICTTARGEGVDLIGLVGSVSGFKKAATWSLVVASQSTKAGTYTISGDGPSGQLDPMTKHPTELSSEAAILNATSGKYTVRGARGTLDVTFGTGKKAVTVKGSWNCSA